MDAERITALAEKVDEAARTGDSIPMLSLDQELTVEEAYEIQAASVDRRRERGEWLVGMKMGLTSLAKMEQVGVDEPIHGFLTDAMMVSNGGEVSLSRMVHPRVEPEIAFLIGEDIEGPVSEAEAAKAVRGVCAALEIIDSRYRDFKFTLADVIADNTSASAFVLGDNVVSLGDIDIANLGIVMSINGTDRETGSTAAIYEHPIRSLTKLLQMISRHGRGLHEGDIVLAGGATAAVAIESGDRVEVEIAGLGRCGFSCVN